MKIQVGDATQYQDIDQGVTLLAVPYSILDDNDVLLQERVQSFPLTATTEEITDFLNRALQVYKDNVARHEETKTLQEGLDNATSVAATISNITITDNGDSNQTA